MFDNYIGLFSPPWFNTSIEANAYFSAWKTQKDKFVGKLKIDPSLGHYKVSMERSKRLFIQISRKNNVFKNFLKISVLAN